jgi:hypothetical protein
MKFGGQNSMLNSSIKETSHPILEKSKSTSPEAKRHKLKKQSTRHLEN